MRNINTMIIYACTCIDIYACVSDMDIMVYLHLYVSLSLSVDLHIIDDKHNIYTCDVVMRWADGGGRDAVDGDAAAMS